MKKNNKMTSEQINITETRFNCYVKTDGLIEEYLTPKLLLSGMHWRFKICKATTNDGDDVIKVFLFASLQTGISAYR